MSELKKELYKKCLDYVQNRMDAAQQAINEAQKASNEDTKSSAGDKYETGRAMFQQETDRNFVQLNEANKLKVALSRVNTSVDTSSVVTGSLVITNNGNFYIAISAGSLIIEKNVYFAISQESPIGLKFKGLKKNDEFLLNGKLYIIKSVS